MIPLTDASRRHLHFPAATVLIIGLNFIVFFIELAGGDAFVNRWVMVPANIVAGHGWLTILTAMFMHAGWEHILGNMLFLWVFGPAIEDAMGSTRYMAFYLLGGCAATFAQIAIDPSSTIPNMGASGAIAAVMGVFMITYPRDRIKTVLFLGWFVSIRYIPAMVLVGLWFIIQLFSQFGAMVQVNTGGVAYMAHLGGFIFGMVAGRFFELPARVEEQWRNR